MEASPRRWGTEQVEEELFNGIAPVEASAVIDFGVPLREEESFVIVRRRNKRRAKWHDRA